MTRKLFETPWVTLSPEPIEPRALFLLTPQERCMNLLTFHGLKESTKKKKKNLQTCVLACFKTNAIICFNDTPMSHTKMGWGEGRGEGKGMHRGQKALKQSCSLTIGQNLARNMTDDVIRGCPCPTILNAKQELQGNRLHIKE